jgi:phenylacetate-CoA ligase
MPTNDLSTNALQDAERSAVIERLCERAWERFPEITDRLRDAGFGPGHWPSLYELRRVAVLAKESIAQLQALEPPFGTLRAAELRRPESLFCSPGQLFEPDMPSARTRLARLLHGQGFGEGDLVLNGFNYHLTPAGLLFHGALVEIGCTVIPGGPHNTDALVDILLRSGANGFVGIAAHLKLIVDRFFELEHRPDQLRLRKAMAGGEPGAWKTREELKTRFGIRAFDMYGTAEVGIVAVGNPDGGGMRIDPDVIVEILDPTTKDPVAPGAAGHVILTVDDPDYPMLRLGTGDLGRVENSSGADSLFLLGRLGNSARVRGMLLHEAQMRDCLHAHPAIQGLQIQITRDAGRDGIVAILQAPPEDFRQAAAALCVRFGALCRLKLDRVDAAPAPLGTAPLILDQRVYETEADR